MTHTVWRRDEEGHWSVVGCGFDLDEARFISSLLNEQAALPPLGSGVRCTVLPDGERPSPQPEQW